MEVIAKGKYIQLSPKKAREIASMVRGQNAKAAQVMVKNMPHKSAQVIEKVLASAMANAENNFNLDRNELTVAQIMVDGGPSLKRWKPAAKGAAHPRLKRTSHITVVVSGDVQNKVKKQEEKKQTQKPEVESKEDEHKVEVERPEFVKNERAAGQPVKSKFFRRKTG